MRYLGYGMLAFFAFIVVVAVWQEAREQRKLAQRRRAFFDAQDKLEPTTSARFVVGGLPPGTFLDIDVRRGEIVGWLFISPERDAAERVLRSAGLTREVEEPK